MSTPLEINKKIGKLRYDYARSIEVNGKLIGNDVVCHNECWITELRLADSKNWAEKIADAWELFEEMPNPKLQLFNRDDAGMVRFPWRVKIDFNKDMEFLGSTAQLAICKAWLAWKENEK